jgi:hypothetical protein
MPLMINENRQIINTRIGLPALSLTPYGQSSIISSKSAFYLYIRGIRASALMR